MISPCATVAMRFAADYHFFAAHAFSVDAIIHAAAISPFSFTMMLSRPI